MYWDVVFLASKLIWSQCPMQLFSKAGPVKRIVMGLDKHKKTPCGFCFVIYYTRQATEDCVTFISGTKLDDRRVRCDYDWGFQDDRQFGRGRSGGQASDLVMLPHLATLKHSSNEPALHVCYAATLHSAPSTAGMRGRLQPRAVNP